jgi:alpha-mannosidase
VAVNADTLTYEEKEKHEKPMSGFAYKREGNRGLCFVSGGGLHEVGAFEGAEGMLAVTLLRCFGSAVSGYESVDGQQPGVSTFRFGLLPLTATDKDADIQRRLDAFTAGVRYRDDHTWREDAALENHSFYRLDGENTVFSTLKVAEDGEGLCLRMFNMSDTPETATLTFDRVPAEAALVNLEECHPVPLMVEGTAVAVEMPAWAIRTVYLKF